MNNFTQNKYITYYRVFVLSMGFFHPVRIILLKMDILHILESFYPLWTSILLIVKVFYSLWTNDTTYVVLYFKHVQAIFSIHPVQCSRWPLPLEDERGAFFLLCTIKF